MPPVPELEALRENSQAYLCENRKVVDIPPLSDIQIACQGELSLDLSGVSLQAGDGALTPTVREGGFGRERHIASVRDLRNLRILADTSALDLRE